MNFIERFRERARDFAMIGAALTPFVWYLVYITSNRG